MNEEPVLKKNDVEEGRKAVFPKMPFVFLGAGLILGWAVDFLFWSYRSGVSIAIWLVLALIVLLSLARVEKVKLARASYFVIALILCAAAFTVLRLESLTRFANTVAALFGLLLLAATLQNAHWIYYRMIDYFLPLMRTVFASLFRPFSMFSGQSRTENGTGNEKSRVGKVLLSILRGLIIVIPLLFILGGLLASADTVFEDQLQRFFDLFSIENLPEYIFRLTYISIFSLVFLGVLLQALLPKDKPEKPDPNKALFQPFLGWIETVMVFGGINLMFLVFVVIQFNYLFGGQRNIHPQGFIYAEYARRGFAELVAVAILSLLIYLSLVVISRRETTGKKHWFSGFSILLILQVLVILVSSFQRLGLYEAVYGFSRLRMYTHIFIICLAVLLLVVMVLEIIGMKGRFGLAFLGFCYLFTFTLAIVNVDGMIAKQNIIHSTTILHSAGARVLDYDYIRMLSNDATAQLIKSFANLDLPDNTHEKIGAVLACRIYAYQNIEPVNWRSYHPVNTFAENKLLAIQPQLDKIYSVAEEEDGVFVHTAKNTWQCDAPWSEYMD